MIPDRTDLMKIWANRYFPENERGQFKDLIYETAISLCDSVFKNLGTPYWFTDHGPKHSDSVFHYSLHLARIASDYAGYLNKLEATALAASCYLHDIGMVHLKEFHDIANQGWTPSIIMSIRSWHVEAISEILPLYKDKLMPLYREIPQLEYLIPILCKCHGTKSHETACREIRSPEYSNNFKGDLLGKILLLADELDLESHRSLIDDHPQQEKFPIEARAHQYKHHYIIDVNVRLPQVTISFAFHEDLDEEDKNNFIKWTIIKLNKQLALISKDIPSQYNPIFELEFKANQLDALKSRQFCPSEINDFVKKQIQKLDQEIDDTKIRRKFRPNQFLENRNLPRKHGPLYPLLDRLMDEFFRQCTTPIASKVFNDLYVDIPENDKVSEELVRYFNYYRKEIRLNKSKQLLSFRLFVITGRTGCGKSALLQKLMRMGPLKSKFSYNMSGRLVVYVDCLNHLSYEEIIRAMLRGLRQQCKYNKKVWRSLCRLGWNKCLNDALLSVQKIEYVTDILRGLVETLTSGVSRPRMILPVCFLLDNLDRVPTLELKLKIVKFTIGETSKGTSFYVLTLRYGTKSIIDDKSDELAAIPTHSISAPNHIDILSKRLDTAFSEKVLSGAKSWCEPQEVKTLLGKMQWKISDLRDFLKNVMYILTTKKYFKHTPLILGLSGLNIRDSLTLYRAIIKSMDVHELLKIKLGHIREHYLIRCLMLEGEPCYFASRSKIRNIFNFNSFIDTPYLIKPYLLKLLSYLQDRDKAQCVSFEMWRREALIKGIKENIFRETAWALMTKSFALVKVDNKDDFLPDDKYPTIDHLRPETEVRLSAAGKYFLSWLIYDFSYLQCVLQDTPMPLDLAHELAEEQVNRERIINQVEKFLRFLEKQEEKELSSSMVGDWSPINPIIPEIIERFERQKRLFIGSKS